MDKIVNAVKDASKIAELKLRIVEKEAIKEGLMNKLGKEVYEAYPAVNLAMVGELVEEARKVEVEINTYNEAIIAIKGLLKCPTCGMLVKDNMKYCGQCGTKLVEDEPTEEPTTTTDEAEPNPTTDTPYEE